MVFVVDYGGVDVCVVNGLHCNKKFQHAAMRLNPQRRRDGMGVGGDRNFAERDGKRGGRGGGRGGGWQGGGGRGGRGGSGQSVGSSRQVNIVQHFYW